MNKNVLLLMIAFAALVFFGASCASTSKAPESKNSEAKSFTAPDDRGSVFLYRTGRAVGAAGQLMVRVNSQEERGIAYRNYSEKAFSHPALIGLAWFQWNDQEMFGRGDGENYNIGLVDITDRAYPHLVDAIKAVSANSYEVHRGVREPFFRELYCYGGKFPDIWE